MPRGYRCIVLAALGWLALCGSKPSPQTSSAPEKSQATDAVAKRGGKASPLVAPTTIKQIDKPKKTEPCGPRRYNSDDDLCAQWKAADSAQDAANYSKWSLILAAVGTLGLLVSLHYTRKAVLAAEDATKDADKALAIAERNADAAAAQVAVARDTARHQLRAYVQISTVMMKFETPWPVGFVPDEDKTKRVHFKFIISNTGATPAINLVARTFVEYRKRGNGAGCHDVEYGDVGNSVEFDRSMNIFYRDFDESNYKTLSVFISVGIGYEDIFGDVHVRDMGFVYYPESSFIYDDSGKPIGANYKTVAPDVWTPMRINQDPAVHKIMEGRLERGEHY